MQYTSTILAAAGLLTTVSAHGMILTPTPRAPGSAMAAACGQQVYTNQESDSYGNIQGELQVAATQSDYDEAECDIWLCKGYKYADNTALLETYTAGQTVDFTFDVRAPHVGTANVSIVDTVTNTIIGSPLITYSDFADNSIAQANWPANWTTFSITIPSDLGTTCATAGDCVIQHYWNAASIDQTYESCVDFTVGGSGAASSGTTTAAVVATTSAAAASSAVASSATVMSSATAVSSSAPVTTSAAVASVTPTTLQTLAASSTVSTSAQAAATNATDPDDDEDTCS